ncbi:MAG TPA: hypothetical protein VKS81_01150 [Bacteroidota bacterium]|nr:hypothetical protein [Bacteroidota bacterium]
MPKFEYDDVCHSEQSEESPTIVGSTATGDPSLTLRMTSLMCAV